MPLLRGQDVRVDIYVNGEPVATVAPVSFSYKPRMEISQIQRLGSRTETIDTDGVRGYEGDIAFEMENFALTEFEYAIVQRQLAGLPVDRVNIVATETNPNTLEQRHLVFPNALMVPSTTVSSRRDAVKKSFKWESEVMKQI